MDIKHHYSLKTGPAPSGVDKNAMLSVVDLGELHVPSGNLGACDPFDNLAKPVVIVIPPGTYPVRVTVADVSDEQDGSHLREAYLSVVLSDAEATAVEVAPSTEGELEPGQFWGVGVDTGTVAFVDADAVATSMPDEDEVDWFDEIFESGENSWFAQMDADGPLPAGTANIVMPLAKHGENVVLAHSGWGDGFYPIVQTRDADGNVIGIHIDMRVVGDPTNEDKPGA